MKRSLYGIGSRIRYGWLGAAFIVALSGLAFGRFVVASDDTPKASTVSLSVSEDPVPRDTSGHFTTSFAPVVKKVAASVVKINVVTKSKSVPAQQMQSPFGDEFMQRFFGGQMGPQGQGGRMMQTPRQEGVGSGVIVGKDGYILTNNHVVDSADTISVTLNDGRKFTAKVVGRDPKTDIAVVKIDAKNLPNITIADSDKIEIGDVCLAIGNPFNVGQTVTMGIVSATGRTHIGVNEDQESYEDFIQTDAAINPGNSGGALVDTEGRLIGINTAIYSRTGGYQGIGFAVPIDMARNVMESLITKGKVVRGYLGVSIQDVTPDLASEFNMKGEHGALVGDVMPKSPADKAGLKSGDVIVGFNNKPVSDSSHLRFQVADTAPGTSVSVKILREGKEETVNVTVKELPGSETLAKADGKADNANDTLNGVTVGDLDPRATRQMNLPDSIKGAMVTDVDQDSAAFEAGLRPGDVIEEINHKPVKSADDAVKLTENVKDKRTLLKVWSAAGNRSGSHYVVVDESKTD